MNDRTDERTAQKYNAFAVSVGWQMHKNQTDTSSLHSTT